jgi:hypothetical protein
VLAFVALFATIAVRSLTTGQSVRASFSYAGLFLAVLLVLALAIYGVNRRRAP